MKFTKMHGIGNDYVYVNCFEETVADPAQLAQDVSDRHFGIGSDGLILVMPSDQADVRMRMFNADGSESQMCGNGVRCVAKFAYDRQLVTGQPVTNPQLQQLLSAAAPQADKIEQIQVETGRGVLTIALAVVGQKAVQLCVDMGEPILEPQQIPVDLSGEKAVNVDFSLDAPAFTGKMTCVSMGNPHVVFYCDDVQAIDLEKIGPAIEKHPLFPERINVHFVQVVKPDEVIMRTWERGSGITLACGTGASAVCVAGVLTGQSDQRVLAHLPGGDLVLQWPQQPNTVYMVGSATEVFQGVWPD